MSTCKKSQPHLLLMWLTCVYFHMSCDMIVIGTFSGQSNFWAKDANPIAMKIRSMAPISSAAPGVMTCNSRL